MSIEAAEKVIRFLDGRGGFDAWWEDIDRDTRQEIKEGLATLLSESRGELRASERQGVGITDSPWARFLGARAELIHEARERHESDASIASWLSADPGQVGLIAATPLKSIVCTRAWLAERTPSQPAPSADAAMARWASECVDAWAVKHECDVPTPRRKRDGSWFVFWVVVAHGDVWSEHETTGPTPDAARIAAAEALAKADPTLPRPPGAT